MCSSNEGKDNTVTIDISEELVKYLPCPLGGKHNMRGNGSGDIREKKGKVLLKGHCFRCDKCGMIMIGQYSPFQGSNKVGRYHTGSGPVANYTVMIVAKGTKLPVNNRLNEDNFFKGIVWTA